MPSVEVKIWMALKSRINSYQTSMPILMPADKELQPNVSYIRVGRVAVDPAPVLIDYGKKHQRTGFLMLTLVEPMNDWIEVYDDNAGKIAAYFKDGTQMKYDDVCVTVTNYPYVMDGYEDNGYWTTPVRIPWRCFA